jgi:DNA-binding response OmpR family regulator
MGNKKIVLIEDDKILSKVVYEELKEADFDVSQAFDGEEGLKLATDKKPNLILLDLLLPKKHGFEVLEELKKSSVTNSVPVIILTMLGSDEDIKKGLKLGANDYIVKSQHAVSEIIDKVKKFFETEIHPEERKPGKPASLAEEVQKIKEKK